MRNWILAVALIAMKFTRPLLSGILVGTLALGLGQAQTPASAPAHNSSRGVLYAAGAELTQYDVDAEGALLAKRSSIRLPANVQYAWPHPSRKYFYVAWSDGGASAAAPGTAAVPRGKLHGVSAFRIDPRSGALQPIGQPVSLAWRPIHLSTDISGTNVLSAYNDPSGVTVHRLNADGTIGALVKPALHAGYGNLRAPGACGCFEQDCNSGDARQRSDEGHPSLSPAERGM